MNQHLENLWQKLNQGPTFLWLGQDYLRISSDRDPFLDAIWRKFGSHDTEAQSYRDLLTVLDNSSSSKIEDQLTWMQKCRDRLSVPDWLSVVAQLHWNGVYTSAIDGIWVKAFRTEWREIESLFEEKFKPADPRNRSRLHCTFLFGAVDRSAEMERPPLDEFTFTEREDVAIVLARRLPEILTPFGTLLIEGYSGDQDWFSPKRLYSVLSTTGNEQAHLFSATPAIERNQYIQELTRRQKLVLHTQSLAQFLLQGQESGFLQLGQPIVEQQHGRRIQIENNVLNGPQHLWSQVSKSAIILDDTVLFPKPISEEQRYSSFRQFLGEASNRPVWDGYAHGFAFQRDFEQKLLAEVEGKLKSHELKDEPIIVHGQAGTGKSVALGSIAYHTHKQRKYPVLYIERKSQRLISSDIDAFCQWAEDAGASKTLVVWDGMVRYEDYSTLLRDLESRGRKVVLVGSCYRLSESSNQIPHRARRNFFEASAQLTSKEASRFIDFLGTFDKQLKKTAGEWIKTGEDRFLVALYHRLPATRTTLRRAVASEAVYAEQEILRQQPNVPIRPRSTTLGQALLNKGLIVDAHLFTETSQEIAGEQKTQLQQLIGLVMVPGQFGIRVPLDLLMRVLQRGITLDFISLLKRINTDLLQWHTDGNGNISVGPRHSLEAQLILQSDRYGGKAVEIELAKQLLIEIQEGSSFGDDTEIQFAFELIRSFGPNGPRQRYYLDSYRLLSTTLSKLREERGIQNPRLMLQEATLLREFVKDAEALDWKTIKALHTQAKEVLEDAIEILESSDSINRRLLSTILVELASVDGSYAYECVKAEQSLDSIRILFQNAKQQAFRAFSLNPDYYAIDVVGWATERFLSQSHIPSTEKAEAIADVMHAFAIAGEESFDVLQQTKFQERRQTFGQFINDKSLADNAFATLSASGSAVGYYLRAQSMLGALRNSLWTNTAKFTADDRVVCQKVVQYLQEYYPVISRDERCLFLLLRLWWIMKVGKPMFYPGRERQSVPFGLDDWQYCLNLVDTIIGQSQFTVKAELLFLRGFALFHLEQIRESFEVFHELERQVDKTGRQRVVRSYVASEILNEFSFSTEGKPKKFTGEVQWRNPDASKVGRVYVSELRYSIPFIPNDFKRPLIRPHESLGTFHIAFNFLGPIAEPAERSQAAMGKES